MFRKIARLFTSTAEEKISAKYTKKAEIDSAELYLRYKHDYIDSGYLSVLPDPIQSDLRIPPIQTEPRYIIPRIREAHLWRKLYDHHYLDPLCRKMKQTTFIDEYGDECRDSWDKELKKFISNKFDNLSSKYDFDPFYIEQAKLSGHPFQIGYFDSYAPNGKLYSLLEQQECEEEQLFEDIDLMVRIYSIYLNQNKKPDTLTDLNQIEDPYEYEHAIAEYLAQLGWEAKATLGSGDQGIDVVANNNGIKLVVQCKLYSDPVGNKAIQEIYAGLGFEEADIAAVVTNSSYTKSARKLASSLGVELLHHNELDEFSSRLFQNEYKFLAEQSPDEKSYLNTIDIVRNISQRLESTGWGTSYDPEDPLEEESNFISTLVAIKGEHMFMFYCTHLKSEPVDLNVMQHIHKIHLSINEEDKYEFGVVASSTGFTDEAIDYCLDYEDEGFTTILNDSIEDVNNWLLIMDEY